MKTKNLTNIDIAVALVPLIIGMFVQNSVITLFGAVLLVRALLPKPLIFNPSTLPQSFISLESEQKKQALDYAWNSAKREMDSIPAKTIIRTIIGFSLWGIAFLSGIVMLLAMVRRLENENIIGFYIFIFSLAVVSLASYFALKKNVQAKHALKEETHNAKMNKRLTLLAKRFINSHVKNWVNEIKSTQIDQGVLEIAHSTPDHTYTLYSEDTVLFSEQKMPASVLHLTYVLVGQYMTVVDKIQIDIRKISYNYVLEDSPALPSQNKNLYSSEEFHYKDMIEIGYKSEQDNRTFGKLFISLVNGTHKEYPTSKSYVENLFTDVRARVREAKLG